MNFDKLEAAIKELCKQDAVHRKGFRIREATPELALANMTEELGEYMVARLLEKDDITREPAEAIAELADVLAVFIHLLIMVTDEHWLTNPIHLETVAIAKLKKRFKAPK